MDSQADLSGVGASANWALGKKYTLAGHPAQAGELTLGRTEDILAFHIVEIGAGLISREMIFGFVFGERYLNNVSGLFPGHGEGLQHGLGSRIEFIQHLSGPVLI
jgi:hypothetical protein